MAGVEASPRALGHILVGEGHNVVGQVCIMEEEVVGLIVLSEWRLLGEFFQDGEPPHHGDHRDDLQLGMPQQHPRGQQL